MSSSHCSAEDERQFESKHKDTAIVTCYQLSLASSPRLSTFDLATMPAERAGVRAPLLLVYMIAYNA
jgi:hypothetical protein